LSIAGWLTLAVFILFFGLVCPVFIYWFNHFLKKAMIEGVSFIGFPQDREPRD
jgi:hypothetical protein